MKLIKSATKFFLFGMVIGLPVLILAQTTPTIVVQPQSQTVGAGSNVTFTVGAGGGGEPSLPSVASGTLKLWLKADTGVITTSDRVSQWQDQSPNQNHAFQSDAAKQPLLVNGAVPTSGYPVVRFDGIQSPSTGDFLQGTGNVAVPFGYTSFLVYSVADREVVEQVVAVIGNPGEYHSIRSYYIRTGLTPMPNEMAFSGWGNDYGTAFSIPPNTFRIWTDRMSQDKTQLEFFDTDGSTSFTNLQHAGGLATPATGYYVGGLGSFTRNFQGDVAELLFYQGSLDEADRVSVESYLKQKYYQSSTPGGGTLTYQWQFDGTNVAGATASSLVLTNVQPGTAGIYTVIVSNNFGGTTSSNAILAVIVPPSITTQPTDLSVQSGINVTFSVVATGTSPNYQWLFNGSVIADATNTSYSVEAVQATNAGNYSVTVSNAAGSVTSAAASLEIVVPPSIFSQPQSHEAILAGGTVNLSVTAEAVLPIPLSGNLRLWLKADQGAVIANGHVSEWRDQSTNGNHAFQPNTNKQPLFVSDAVPNSNKPAVRFDGIQDVSTGDWMRGTNTVGIPSGYTSFLVYLRAERTIAEQAAVGFGMPAQQSALRSYFVRNSGEMAFSGWNNDYGTGFNIPADTYRIWADRLNEAKNQLEFFDVTETNEIAFKRNVGGLGAPGAGYYIGGLDSFTRNFKGDIAELIVYQGALNDTDRNEVQNYLKAKYYFGVGGNGLSYQWQLNGTNILGATNSSFAITNAQPGQSGNYTVAITNAVGSITSEPAVVKIRYLFPRGNGLRLTNEQYSYVGSVNVSFENYFNNGLVFYTLDGSAPNFSSKSYTGPFALTRSATLRSITYSSDFLLQGESDPVEITIVPTYTLTTFTRGGGTVLVDASGPQLSGTVANVTANPSVGWTFLQWLGDASGTNPTTTVTLTRNKTVEAVFGTTLNTTVAGNGVVSASPATTLYPFGTTVQLTAIPQPGNFFGVWGNAASGNTNPLSFTIVAPMPTVSSLFSSLGANQYSLSISANGAGRVSASPRANSFSNGQTVTLTATPEPGQLFTGWSGDASGVVNPLTTTMNQSKAITANFTSLPHLTLRLSPSTFDFEGFQLILTGKAPENYFLQKSTDLMDWFTVTTLTNSYGTVQFTDAPSTNSNQQYYRVVQP